MGSMGLLLADWSVELFRARRKKAKKANKMDAAGSGDSSSSSEDERDLDDDKVPSVEDVDRLEDRLEAAQSEQKNLFLIVFQRYE